MADVLTRHDEELELLRSNFPELEYVADGKWVLLKNQDVVGEGWDHATVDICFQIPDQLPGQQPYGFYVHPALGRTDGATISNYAFPAPTTFGPDWAKFSWQLLEWNPAADVIAGTNMVNFVRSFRDRLMEGA